MRCSAGPSPLQSARLVAAVAELGSRRHRTRPMKSKPALFVGIVCVIFIIAALALSVTQLYSGAPPKIEYVGRSPDNSELLFDIRNSTSSAWSFYGAGPNAPTYEFQMPSGRRVQEMASPATTTVKKLARYRVPTPGKVSFAI